MFRQKLILSMLLCTLGAITGCGANEPQPASVRAIPSQATRVVVTFKQPVRFADRAHLDTMQQHANAQFSYVGAISSQTHIYRMAPIAPQSADGAIAGLQRWSAVQQVTQDDKERN